MIEIEVFNNSVKGQITVSKSGEVLTSIKKDDEGNIQFIYEDAFLAGATYNIYANEDILDPRRWQCIVQERYINGYSDNE